MRRWNGGGPPFSREGRKPLFRPHACVAVGMKQHSTIAVFCATERAFAARLTQRHQVPELGSDQVPDRPTFPLFSKEWTEFNPLLQHHPIPLILKQTLKFKALVPFQLPKWGIGGGGTMERRQGLTADTLLGSPPPFWRNWRATLRLRASATDKAACRRSG